MTDKEQIWRRIAEMETPGFFITADIMCEGSSELDGLEVFIKGKITQIQQGQHQDNHHQGKAQAQF